LYFFLSIYQKLINFILFHPYAFEECVSLMITNTPLLFFVLWAPILSWINISSSLILFGLYYGFLTTLPIDLSLILSIKTFLLEGNLRGTMECDSPMFYLLVKRLIHWTFNIIILTCSLLHLDRVHVALLTKKVNNNEFRMSQLKVDGLSWSNRIWPTFFFNYRRWKWPLQYIENSWFNNKGPIKKKQE
jgi:hypothetical protein